MTLEAMFEDNLSNRYISQYSFSEPCISCKLHYSGQRFNVCSVQTCILLINSLKQLKQTKMQYSYCKHALKTAPDLLLDLIVYCLLAYNQDGPYSVLV